MSFKEILLSVLPLPLTDHTNVKKIVEKIEAIKEAIEDRLGDKHSDVRVTVVRDKHSPLLVELHIHDDTSKSFFVPIWVHMTPLGYPVSVGTCKERVFNESELGAAFLTCLSESHFQEWLRSKLGSEP